jgi:hypothetical protein
MSVISDKHIISPQKASLMANRVAKHCSTTIYQDICGKKCYLTDMAFISGKKKLSPLETQLVRKILWRNLNLPLFPILFDYTLHSLIQGVSTFLVFTVIVGGLANRGR